MLWWFLTTVSSVPTIFCHLVRRTNKAKCTLIGFILLKKKDKHYLYIFLYKLVSFCRSTARLTSSTVLMSDILRKVENVTYTVYLFSCIVVRQVHGTYFQVVKDVHYLNFPSIEEPINICANDEEKISLLCANEEIISLIICMFWFISNYTREEKENISKKQADWRERDP